MIVVVPVGQNVFVVAFFSVPTWYIIHRFHLYLSNATLVIDSRSLCSNNDLLTACQYFSGVTRWNEPWIHGSGPFQFNIYIMSVRVLTVFTCSMLLLLFFTYVRTVLFTEVE
jgi:hypothetical protein